jgi:hypothetical protein
MRAAMPGRQPRSTGAIAGSIIPTIITLHMPRKLARAAGHDCPGMRIQVIDMFQPPGMSMPGMCAMDAHQPIVTAALPMNSSVEMPSNARAMHQALAYSS